VPEVIAAAGCVPESAPPRVPVRRISGRFVESLKGLSDQELGAVVALAAVVRVATRQAGLLPDEPPATCRTTSSQAPGGRLFSPRR
jgi:hypothetical protein